MKKLSAFLPWVIPHAYGVTDPYAEQAVRDACIEFCERTEVVQSVETYGLVASDPECNLFAPPQQRLARVIRVTCNDVDLSAVAIDEVRSGAAMRAGVDTVVSPARGTPTSFYQRVPGDSAIYLWPVPDAAAPEALAVRAAFAPTRTASMVEDVLFNDWLPEIVHGALAMLLSTPAQPFTNLVLAGAHRKEFEAAIGAAARDAKRGGTRGSLAVQPRAFA